MKTLREIGFSALVVSLLGFVGCALFDKDATQADKEKDVRNIAYAAGSIGVEVALLEKPAVRPAIEAAYAQLDKVVRDGAVTGSLLRGIVDALPWKDLKDATAVAIVRGLTTLFDATVGDRLNLQSAPMVTAAATGLRDGMKSALGK
jgi:hypothetical protein